ncbi:MAG: lytic transglycosylase domain-containing protein [Anaerolineae bacterium]|nr:lytic transglycosylase domain-containing protein [Anaerolineae bacterium]
MAVRTHTSRRTRAAVSRPVLVPRWQAVLIRYLPAWLVLAVILGIMLPGIWTASLDFAGRVIREIPHWVNNLFAGPSVIAPLFTPEVDYWSGDIRRWSVEYGVDPNLLATVMQIESCGHPNISSYAGAQGLFQVMPYHFADGENQLDPDTNVKRSISVLQECSGWANGDIGLTLACYNGGPSVVQTSYALWDAQVQRYYTWGSGIYADAVNHQPQSGTLSQWLAAGGSHLCSLAAGELGLH